MTSFLKLLNKKLSEVLKRPRKVAILVVLIAITINLSAPSAIIDEFKISYNSLFSGMLALIGFIFAARTFITFKLYETVYSTERYQKRILGLKKEGAYKKKLMHPLSTLDSSLSFTTTLSVTALLFLTVISFVDPPKEQNIKNIFDIFLYIFVEHETISSGIIKSNIYPVGYKLLSDIICSTFIVVFIQLVYNLRSLNKNVSSIIDIWQEISEENEEKFKKE